MSLMDDVKAELKKGFKQGLRDGARPSLAYGLAMMYEDVNDKRPQSYWDAEAEELMDYMRDFAKAKKGSKA